jgi:uncharacterized membrane protein YidH (DUF202 family)
MEEIMKSRMLIGIVLIVFGCISLAYAEISYNRRHTVFQIGDLKATANQTETIPLSPILGGVALIAGVAILTLGRGDRLV